MRNLEPMARLIYGPDDVPAVELRSTRRRKVLLLMSRRGTATQEALVPLMELTAAGVSVMIGSDDAGDVEFDWACNLLASVERLWSPVHDMRLELGRAALRAHKVDVSNLEWLDRFDAVLVPGGHGPEYGTFIMSDFVQQVVRAFVDSDKLVALQCHSVVAAALDGPQGEVPFGFGRQVTCWPASVERMLGRLPFVGRHFLPLGKLTEELVAPVTGRVHVAANPRRMPHVVVDGPLVTSWGPWSGRLVAQTLLAMIETRTRHARPFELERHHAA
jgi:putative intracellular protease/amidase